MTNGRDRDIDHGHGGDVCPDTGCFVQFDPLILRSKPLLWAYATSIVILSTGLVVLVLGLAALCFFFPDKANAVIILAGSPLLALLMGQAPKMARMAKRIGRAQDKQ